MEIMRQRLYSTRLQLLRWWFDRLLNADPNLRPGRRGCIHLLRQHLTRLLVNT
jgi:hypothetical protein